MPLGGIEAPPYATQQNSFGVRGSGMQTGKIIAFDSWTGGVENIQRIVPAFQERGLDLVLVHIGSWGHDLGRSREERIGNLLVRDIDYYQGLSFREILLQERPDAVLFLSTQAFAHRAFNQYCRELGIPTLHLYHGVHGVLINASKHRTPFNISRQLTFVWSRFAKNLFRLWPVYAKALWQTGAPLRDWFWFGYDIWRKGLGQSYSEKAAPDASTTACCVYTEGDISHAAERYRLPQQAILAVGNADLEKFGLKEEDIGICLSPDRKTTKEILYIDTALIDVGAGFDDAEDFIRHLQKTREALISQGLRLVVKLHPVHARTGVADRLRQLNFELCANEDFVTRLKASSAVIVEPSTAALVPALLGLPLLLARYGKLSEQEYGPVLTSYPRMRVLRSLDGLAQIVEEMAKSTHPEETRAWLEANTGPLPAERMPERVADVMLKIIKLNRVP